jgi:hypothetical protein
MKNEILSQPQIVPFDGLDPVMASYFDGNAQSRYKVLQKESGIWLLIQAIEPGLHKSNISPTTIFPYRIHTILTVNNVPSHLKKNTLLTLSLLNLYSHKMSGTSGNS